jgi:hypothetical protein
MKWILLTFGVNKMLRKGLVRGKLSTLGNIAFNQNKAKVKQSKPKHSLRWERKYLMQGEEVNKNIKGKWRIIGD